MDQTMLSSDPPTHDDLARTLTDIAVTQVSRSFALSTEVRVKRRETDEMISKLHARRKGPQSPPPSIERPERPDEEHMNSSPPVAAVTPPMSFHGDLMALEPEAGLGGTASDVVGDPSLKRLAHFGPLEEVHVEEGVLPEKKSNSAAQPRSKPGTGREKRVTKKAKLNDAINLTEFDKSVIYSIAAESDDGGEGPTTLVPVAGDELEGRVENHWETALRQQNKTLYVGHLRFWLDNRPPGYCAFARVVANERSRRYNNQTILQVCDGCVKLQRPCLDWVTSTDGGSQNLVVLPQKTSDPVNRYGYFD